MMRCRVGVRCPVPTNMFRRETCTFHRNARDFRAHRGEQDVHPDRAFAAERPADERTDHAHIFHFKAEGFGHARSARLSQTASHHKA